MKVLVTGGHGFIAGYVIEELNRRGIQTVTNVEHDEENPILKETQVYRVNILDKAGMYGIIQKCDGVIHLAGLLGTSENMRQARLLNEVNVGGALNVLDALDQFRLPGSFIGVGNYFCNNPYSISKTMAERYVMMYAESFKTKVNVTRTFDAIGPRQKWGKINKILPTFINKAIRNEDILVYGGKSQCSTIDLIYVGDIAKILIDSLMLAKNGDIGNTFQAGSGIPRKVWDIAEDVVAACHSSSKIIEVKMREGEAEASHIVADKPFPIPEMKSYESVLAETIEYYKNV